MTRLEELRKQQQEIDAKVREEEKREIGASLIDHFKRLGGMEPFTVFDTVEKALRTRDNSIAPKDFRENLENLAAGLNPDTEKSPRRRFSRSQC